MKWLFCDVDDTVRAALMLALAAVALNLTERASRRSGTHFPTNDTVGEGILLTREGARTDFNRQTVLMGETHGNENR
jgi:hypothetical protein